jgi:Amiloride-sensitive sodium channel
MEKEADELKTIKSKIFYLKKLFDLVETSSCHGLPNIIRSKNYSIKIIWSIAFLASFIYSLISIVNTVNEFLDFNVVVNMELIQDYDLEFPAVTICNNNPFDFTDNEAVEKIETFLKNVTNTNENYFIFKNQTITNSSCDGSLREFLQRSFINYGFSLEKMLIKCFYDAKKCSRDDFFLTKSGLFGKCYTFNNGKYYNGSKAPTRKVKRNGMLNGLKLEFFLGAREYLPCWVNENAALVVIHNKTTNPLFVEEGIKAPVGMETNFVIKNLKISKLPYPFSGCIMDLYSENSFTSSSFKNTVRSNGIYSQKWCILNCALDLTFKQNAKNCSATNFQCLNDLSILADFYSSCLNYCPIECEANYFSVNQHFSKYPSFSYGKHLLARDDVVAKYPYANISMDQLEDSIVSINVYYESSIYQKITETAETNTISLISNLGGILGLFLGISLLSMVELIEISIAIVQLFFKKI